MDTRNKTKTNVLSRPVEDWKKLFTDSVSGNKKYLTDTLSVNKKYLTDTPHGKFFLVRKR